MISQQCLYENIYKIRRYQSKSFRILPVDEFNKVTWALDGILLYN